MSPRVVLIGPPGAGKTSVAAALGRLLDTPARDTDADVETLAGASVADIFVDQGESAFRDLEREVVVRALDEQDGVLAVGGGAVMDPLTEADLAGMPVVFLDVSIAHAARRLGFNQSRPTHVVNPRAQWLRMMEGRRPVYERLAVATVSTDDKTVEDVAAEVVSALGLGRPA
jgi:shikimate kinase